MPVLDLSDALLEPTFQDYFTVQRRMETVSNGGLSTVKRSSFAANGVITMASGNELDREPEEQHQGKSIHIVTRARLTGVAPGFQPDIIVWHGDNFIVRKVEDYSGYGRGWLQVECTSVDFVDQAPSVLLGELDFSEDRNSGLLGAVTCFCL